MRLPQDINLASSVISTQPSWELNIIDSLINSVVFFSSSFLIELVPAISYSCYSMKRLRTVPTPLVMMPVFENKISSAPPIFSEASMVLTKLVPLPTWNATPSDIAKGNPSGITTRKMAAMLRAMLIRPSNEWFEKGSCPGWKFLIKWWVIKMQAKTPLKTRPTI